MVMDFPYAGKSGKDVGEPVFVVQLAIVHQQHDRHGCELLGTRRQSEICVCVYFAAGMKIGDAVATLEHDFSVFDDKDRGAGRLSDLSPSKI